VALKTKAYVLNAKIDGAVPMDADLRIERECVSIQCGNLVLEIQRSDIRRLLNSEANVFDADPLTETAGAEGAEKGNYRQMVCNRR
jgi:hypothetical protein